MSTKIIFACMLLGLSATTYAKGISEFNIPFGYKIQSGNVDGAVTIDLVSAVESSVKINKEFYGVDTHGFSVLPSAPLVIPLRAGYVKLGGSLHSTYNWELNAYYDRNGDNISYVYSPLVRRLEYIQKNYRSTPMFQVNMLGWQPDLDDSDKIVMRETATAAHAAKAITFINGTKKMGLKHILMGNEPFHAEEVHGRVLPSADEYIAKFIDYAVALRDAQQKVSGNSNDIKLWGPEIATGWTGWQTTHPDDCTVDYDLAETMKCSYGNGAFSEFIPYFLSKIAEFEKDSVRNPKKYKLLDYLTFHYYPLFRSEFSDETSILLNKNGEQNVAGMLESVNLWDSTNYVNKYDSASPKGTRPMLVKKFQKWRNQYYANAKIAVTEYGIDSVDKIQYHPIVRPLYLADLVGRVGVAGLDTFVNSFLQAGDTGNSWAMIHGEEKTRLYHVYSLFSHHFVGDVIQSDDNYGDMVNVYTVKTRTGTNVFLVNKDTKKHNTDLKFKNEAGINKITEVELPSWSLTVLSVPNNQSEGIKVYQYGANEMGIDVKLAK